MFCIPQRTLTIQTDVLEFFFQVEKKSFLRAVRYRDQLMLLSYHHKRLFH